MKTFIFIYGPPGVGKSTCGQRLADNLDMPFIDLDLNIENDTGLDVPTIFETKGQAHFREKESAALKATINGNAQVVALGGGALLDPSNQTLVEKHGQVICLNASPETLHKRLSNDRGNERPLLKDNNLFELLDARQKHYASFPLQVNADGLSPNQIVQEIQTYLGVFRVSGMGSDYKVYIGDGYLAHLEDMIDTAALKQPLAIISDSNVAEHTRPTLERLKHAGIEASLIVFPAGETNKNLEVVSQVWEEMLKAKMDRHGSVIALGGGVTNDLAGFAAATYMRGVAWASIPTSLLGMVDASLGGKTGVNLPVGKNLVGAFHSPRLVLVDPTMLNTLPEVEMRNGLAEVVKHAVIGDPTLFDLCARGLTEIAKDWTPLVNRAASVKIHIIQADPFEQNIRETLNLGHTVGHALEVLSGYSIRHGEAVAIGMVTETLFAERLGIAPIGLAEQIAAVFRSLGLPIELPNHINHEAIVETMQFDKKRKGGKLRFALPAQIGEVHHGVEIKNITELMAEL
jgi:3-dehydroquinate synthase